MAWMEPKTNWKSTDYFNAEDYKKTYRDLKIPNTTLIPWI